MNEQFSDQVFDSLLREAITECHPPDLTERIMASWRASRNARPRGAVSGASDSDLRDAPDLPGVSTDPVPRSAERGLAVGPRPEEVGGAARQGGRVDQDASARVVLASASSRMQGPGFWMVVAAASIAVAIATPLLVDRFENSLGDPAARLPAADDSDGSSPSPALSTSTRDRERSVAETGVGGGKAPSGIREPVPGSRDLPELFPVDRPPIVENAVVSSMAEGGGAEAEPLPDEEVLAEANRLLHQMWADVGVSPSAQAAPAEFLQRAHRVLLGSEAPSRLVSRVSAAGPEDHGTALVRYLLQQDAFVEAWADRWTEELLHRSSIAPESDSGQALRQYLADSLRREIPWGDVVEELLAADLTEDAESIPPQQLVLRALVGGGNHRLIRRIGSHFLGTNLACVRCHDYRSDIDRAQEVAFDRQSAYWSLAALLAGVEARRDAESGRRRIVDRQPEMVVHNAVPPLFFDRLDGRLQAAEPRLPDGRLWNEIAGAETPRQALARWIAQSDALDRAVVNQTWRLVIGRYLVPPVAEVDPIALSYRQALQSLLARQFRTHGRSVVRLVGWIARTDAFNRSPGGIGPSAGLLATDEQLLEWKVREAVFAAAPTLGHGSAGRSLEQSLASVVQWLSRPADRPRDVLLAQPSPQPAKPGAKANPSTASLQLPPLGFVIHREVPTPAEQAFVRRLLAANRLSWEQRVEHIVELSDSDVATGRVQELAKQLLQYRDGDMEQALYDVLWAVNNVSAFH